MTVKLTPETWAHVRYEYERTDKPVDDICLDHGVSPSTLRDRMRRWRWTRRYEPVSPDGPPPMPPRETAAFHGPLPAGGTASCENASDFAVDLAAQPADVCDEAAADSSQIVPRLRGAVARVLPAIEATVGRLAAGPMPAREIERAARTLTAPTRTLRELNALLGQYPCADDDEPQSVEEFRAELARRIDGIIAQQPGMTPPPDFVPYGA
jgi:hypothetical protein